MNLKDLATKAVNAELSKANLKSSAKSAVKSVAQKHTEKHVEKLEKTKVAAEAAWGGLSPKGKFFSVIGVAVVAGIAGIVGVTNAESEPTCAERQSRAISASENYDAAAGEDAKIAASNGIRDLATDYVNNCR